MEQIFNDFHKWEASKVNCVQNSSFQVSLKSIVQPSSHSLSNAGQRSYVSFIVVQFPLLREFFVNCGFPVEDM